VPAQFAYGGAVKKGKKRLVLCFDGTWNTLINPKEFSNIVKLANLVTVSDDEVPQITYYNSGVGTGGRLDQFLGGAFGYGLKSNVKRGLTFLSLNWDVDDEIYLFGFSRGAYTARALAGVIGAVGIPADIKHAEEHWRRYQEISKARPKGSVPRTSPEWIKFESERDAIRRTLAKRGHSRNRDNDDQWEPVRIRCIGVWDTVRSYGVPTGIGLGALPYVFTHWTRGFRDTHFGDTVDFGFHAVAIDERRRPFSPTFWTLRAKTQQDQDKAAEENPKVEQVWFAGVHANVGGSYANSGLSDLTLAWMMAKVQEKTGLKFNEDQAKADVWPCSACTLYTTTRWRWLNPTRAVLPGEATGLWAFLAGLWRRPAGTRINEKVHWSVKERLGWEHTLVDRGVPRKYAPSNLKKNLTPLAVPLPLEVDLLRPDSQRDADHPCPLKVAGLPCQCAKRDVEALLRAASPARGTSPIAA
jgi:uncharacterized protein (DUF2235 family)